MCASFLINIDSGNITNSFYIGMLLNYMTCHECVLKYCVKFEVISPQTKFFNCR